MAARTKSESSWIYCSLIMVVIKEREDGVLELPTHMVCVIISSSLPKCLSRKKEGKKDSEKGLISCSPEGRQSSSSRSTDNHPTPCCDKLSCRCALIPRLLFPTATYRNSSPRSPLHRNAPRRRPVPSSNQLGASMAKRPAPSPHVPSPPTPTNGPTRGLHAGNSRIFQTGFLYRFKITD